MSRFLYTLLTVAVVALSLAAATYCPGHKIRCKKDQTCCSDNLGSYGCCPYQNASCCSDGLHCCPQDTDCDLPHGACKPRPTVQLEKLKPSEEIESNAFAEGSNQLNAGLFFLNNGDKKTCPDGERKCPTSYTCCAEKGGSYACCPFENAVCCSDNIHCCPASHQCNVESGRCDPVKHFR